MNLRSVIVAAALVGLAGTASAQRFGSNKLEVGSDAPELKISEWIKGEKVESIEEGKVYLVEFWATW